MSQLRYRSLIVCLCLCLLPLAGCSKKESSTDDENKNAQNQQDQQKQLSQAPTEEEVRQTIKECFEKYPVPMKDKEVQVVSLSKPMEPSAQFLNSSFPTFL